MKTNAPISHENLSRRPLLSFKNYQYFGCVTTHCMLL